MPRLTITLNDKAYKALEDLQESTGKSKAEVLRSGIALLDFAKKSKDDDDETLALVKDDEIKQKIILP